MDLNQILAFSERKNEVVIPLAEYLSQWASEPSMNANTAGRIVRSIGAPEVIDTAKDERLGRIFSKRTMYRYPCFSELFGIEEPLHEIVQFFRFASEGMQHERQILYLEGPVGSGKSKITEIIKQRAETEPVWVLAVKEGSKTIHSPVFENPLGLFTARQHGKVLEDRFKIPQRRLKAPHSRWVSQQLENLGGDLSQFYVKRMMPSMVNRTCIARVEPGDGMDSDIGILIGRADKGGQFEKYQYTGGLNVSTQGVLDFVEMFKVQSGLLNPFLTAIQEYKYAGDGDVGELPFQGVIIAHSNSAEWETFKQEILNQGVVDRIKVIQIPYCLRVDEEARIYRNEINMSELRDIPCAPQSYELAAQFAVATRLIEGDEGNVDLQTRIRMYNGQSVEKGKEVTILPTTDEMREEANWQEGMSGIPVRFMLKALPDIALSDGKSAGLDPVLIYTRLKQILTRADLPDYFERSPMEVLEEDILPVCNKLVERAIQKAYLENYDVYAAERFDLYVTLADSYQEGDEYKDPESGEVRNREWISAALQRFEKKMNTGNVTDFRKEVIKKVLRFRGASENTTLPSWKALDEHIWRDFEKHNVVPTMAEMLPTIAFVPREKVEDVKKHTEFLARLCAAGYTKEQARRFVEWYMLDKT